MRSQRLMLLVVVLLAFRFEAIADECMDCGEKRIRRYTSTGQQIWPEQSQALCCDFPCFSGYAVRDGNVGWGCRTCPVNNEIVTGDICCSTEDDLGCSDSGGGGGSGGGGWNDDTGCSRDASGACPASCASCN